MRLPVILVQHAPAGGQALAEALVGELIGRAGLDLTLVDRFESIRDDSSDRLTLDGIQGDAAVLDWRSADEILEAVGNIGFHGTRQAHQLDGEVNASAATQSRRLFLFDLRLGVDARVIVAELIRLRESLSVKTFSLAGLAGPSPKKAKPAPVVPAPAPVEAPSPTEPTPGRAPTGDALDRLIDHLDELDV
ncbi:MAG: hypothetical protein AAFU85_03090 [Planctomycetota bacterium]